MMSAMLHRSRLSNEEVAELKKCYLKRHDLRNSF